jgi:sugar phosphate permease
LDRCMTAINCDEKKISLLDGIFIVIKDKKFWPTAMCSFFGSMVSLSFNGLWGGPFLMNVYGMSRARAGGVLSMLALGLIIGAPFMSWLSNRVFHSRKKVLVLSHFGAMCVFIPLAFFTGEFSETQLYIWCFFFNFFLSSLVVVGYSAIKDFFPIQISGTATGVLNIFPFAGATLGQPLIGWYLDSVGSIGGKYPVEAYSTAFKACLISLFLAFSAAMMVKETFVQKAFLSETKQ